MVKMKQQLVKSRKNTYAGTNGRKYLTIHETGNTDRGTGAQTHANLQSNGFSSTWQWQVDDTEAIQSFPHTVRCWHGGDSRGDGNMNSIGIEICVNSDGNFKKAVENAAKLAKKIMKDENIPLSNVVQHNHWSGKNCPTNLRNGRKGINWADFKRMVSGAKAPTSSVKPTTSKATSSSSTSKGESIVDYLNTKGQASSFAARKKLATSHGIIDYKGTEAQNLRLLSIVKDGAKQPASKPISTNRAITRDVQRKLNRYRVVNIANDGIAGPATKKAAVMVYQYELNRQFGANLVVDGIPGSATDAAAVTQRENKAYGNFAHITQILLFLKGVDIKPDGYWQAKSIEATKSYQRSEGLKDDGVPGRATYAKLIR